MSDEIKPAAVKPGHFLPTVARHVRFISGFEPDNSNEIRFVTPDLREWKPVATYREAGIVWVDLAPVEYA